MVEGRGNGRRDGEGNAGGNPAGRSDLAVACQHLPAPVGSAVGGQMRFARSSDSICRRLRRDDTDGIEGEGGSSANRVCDEQAGFDAASGEDADGRPATGKRQFYVLEVHDTQETQYLAGSAVAFHAPLAIAQSAEEAARPCAGYHGSAS